MNGPTHAVHRRLAESSKVIGNVGVRTSPLEVLAFHLVPVKNPTRKDYNPTAIFILIQDSADKLGR